MTEPHHPAMPNRQLTFREFLDAMCRPRGVADNGAERHNPDVSRALRLFVRAQPKDHNADDLLAIVPDDLRPELKGFADVYEAAMTPLSARIATALRRRLHEGS